MEKEFLSLSELQVKLKKGIECLFPKNLWIKAEVSAVKARNGGHCYMELSQTEGGSLVAKAGAVIWSSRYRFIAPYFQSVTGMPISEGMTVLVQVQVNYNELYGLSLVVNDIDAEYSLGQKEQERQLTIERLQKEGLMGLQNGHQLPALPYRLAVVSAEDAAGYRDFMRHLHENQYGFSMKTDLFPALMQGTDCPASIIDALDSVIDSGICYDAVLIMRGGGAKLDLACYDDYDLAAVVAQFPLPVLTAIGHDQDYHVVDMVAFRHLKTPTALADYFLEIYEDEDARLTSLMSRAKRGFIMKISAMESRLSVLEARILSADPRKILQRGYSLALNADGVVVKSAKGLGKGDRMSLMFPDGTLDCRVEDVVMK